MNNLRALPLVALLVGIVLIAASYAWVSVVRGSGPVWTEEDEAAYSEKTLEWREKRGHSHGPRQDLSAQEGEKIEAEFQQQLDKFESADSRGRLMSAVLRWSGMLFCVAGAAGVFVLRMMDENS